MALADFEDYVQRRVETDGVTHRRISEELKERFHGVRGFSIRNIECFCREKGIHKSSRLSESEVLSAVSEAVARVCHLIVININMVRVCTGWTYLWSEDTLWFAGFRWHKSC